MKMIENAPKTVEFVLTPKEFAEYITFEDIEKDVMEELRSKGYKTLVDVCFLTHSETKDEVIIELALIYKG